MPVPLQKLTLPCLLGALTSAEQLSRQSVALRADVDRFLANIRAA
jgi:hypothetical protein